MEIKRRLTKIAKSLSPQVEAMNVAAQMEQMCQRFEELIAYAQEKLDRAASRGKTIGQKAYEDREAADQEVKDAQLAESDENLRDQKESFDERNKIVEKTQKPMTDEEFAETCPDEPPTTEVTPETEAPPATKKKAKKKASKKKK